MTCVGCILRRCLSVAFSNELCRFICGSFMIQMIFVVKNIISIAIFLHRHRPNEFKNLSTWLDTLTKYLVLKCFWTIFNYDLKILVQCNEYVNILTVLIEVSILFLEFVLRAFEIAKMYDPINYESSTPTTPTSAVPDCPNRKYYRKADHR